MPSRTLIARETPLRKTFADASSVKAPLETVYVEFFIRQETLHHRTRHGRGLRDCAAPDASLSQFNKSRAASRVSALLGHLPTPALGHTIGRSMVRG